MQIPLVLWEVEETDRPSGPAARFQKDGWKGIHLNSCSGYEADRVTDFVYRTFPKDAYYVTNIRYFSSYFSDALPEFGFCDFKDTEMTVWLRDDSAEKPLYDFLATLPPRTIEFVIDPERFNNSVRDLLRGLNVRVVRFRDDDEVERMLLSAEDHGAIAKVKLLAAA